jgi:glutathione S-transferase
MQGAIAAMLAAMGFEYIGVDDAIDRAGLRMVVLGHVPSPWGEAAKGFFHIKNLDWAAVRLVYDDERLARWAGQLSGPVVVYDSEPPRSGWEEILGLAERLAPAPALLPAGPAERARALAYAQDFCGKDGLGWNRRLQLVHAGLRKTGGFSERVAGYLGKKYGYDPARAAGYGPCVRELLGRMSAALRASGGDYYFGGLSAVDVYSATFVALFAPLPEAQCAMQPGLRAALEWLDEETRTALDPRLLEHRDMMYARHLALPLSL